MPVIVFKVYGERVGEHRVSAVQSAAVPGKASISMIDNRARFAVKAPTSRPPRSWTRAHCTLRRAFRRQRTGPGSALCEDGRACFCFCRCECHIPPLLLLRLFSSQAQGAFVLRAGAYFCANNQGWHNTATLSIQGRGGGPTLGWWGGLGGIAASPILRRTKGSFAPD